MYTADPDVVKDARKHDRLSFDEMLSLSTFGGTVLQKEAAEYAKKHGIKIEVKSSFSSDPGTVISEEQENSGDHVIGVMRRSGLVALTLHEDKDQQRTSDLVMELDEKNIEVIDFLKFDKHLFLAVSVSDQHERAYLAEIVARRLEGCDHTLRSCGSVSIVSGVQENMSHLYSKIMHILTGYSIPAFGIKKEFTSINIYTGEEVVDTTTNLFHEEFFTNRSRRGT